MAITFQRAALYEEAWSEPLVTVGKKYGLSDNGLRKICKAMNIPVPTVGYWARLAAVIRLREQRFLQVPRALPTRRDHHRRRGVPFARRMTRGSRSVMSTSAALIPRST